MKWGKVSQRYLEAYRAWVDVFFEDPFVRFSLFQIDRRSKEWVTFQPRPGRRLSQDDRLISAYYQFLLVTFGPLRDSKRWCVYPDAGCFRTTGFSIESSSVLIAPTRARLALSTAGSFAVLRRTTLP